MGFIGEIEKELDEMKKLEKITKFLQEVKIEMTKVTWPTKQELVDSTIIVMIAIVFLSILIGIEDSLLVEIIKQIVSG